MSTAPNFYQRLQAAQTALPALSKDAENSYLKSRYVSLPALLAAVRPALAEQSILLISSFEARDQGCFVVTSLVDLLSDGRVSSVFPVSNLEPQKVAAAGTYGLRVNLMQLLAIAAPDNDGNDPQPSWVAAPAPAPQDQLLASQGAPPARAGNWF